MNDHLIMMYPMAAYSLSSSRESVIETPNVEFSGTPAASSPEAPLERRVGPHAGSSHED